MDLSPANAATASLAILTQLRQQCAHMTMVQVHFLKVVTAIVGPNNDFIAQLTGGTGLSDYPDIIYGTPMEWLWNNVIKVKFPNAELFFDVPTNK